MGGQRRGTRRRRRRALRRLRSAQRRRLRGGGAPSRARGARRRGQRRRLRRGGRRVRLLRSDDAGARGAVGGWRAAGDGRRPRDVRPGAAARRTRRPALAHRVRTHFVLTARRDAGAAAPAARRARGEARPMVAASRASSPTARRRCCGEGAHQHASGGAAQGPPALAQHARATRHEAQHAAIEVRTGGGARPERGDGGGIWYELAPRAFRRRFRRGEPGVRARPERRARPPEPRSEAEHARAYAGAYAARRRGRRGAS